ncbi:MAG: flagellar basal body-associated FliL family protein [Salinarimonas sp.]
MSKAVTTIADRDVYDPGMAGRGGAGPSGNHAGEAGKPGRGGFLAALALLTVLAGGTGLGLASIVHERALRVDQTKAAPAPEPLRYMPGTSLFRLEPIITNLRHPHETFIRADIALVLDEPDEGARTRLAAEVSGDIMAYLRTLDLARLEGASGLQFLREDLSERAAIRSEGRVRELILETLVVQ